jgi:hypothetical protein
MGRAEQRCIKANVVKMYDEDNMVLTDIAEEVGVGKETVRAFLKKHGNGCRSLKQAARLSKRHGHLKGKKRPEVSHPIGHRRTVCKGYVEIKTEDGWKREHRLVMEKHLGFSLEVDEIVHHIDGDKTNNVIENLRLMTHGEHTRMHNLRRLYVKHE